MFPIRDANPTRIRPLITWALVAVNVFVFFAIQPRDQLEAAEFSYRNAAIACEITTGDPLDWVEIAQDRCTDRPLGDAAFPQKDIWMSVGVSMFLHGGLAHLLFNMWSLWIFGNNVEEAFGSAGYLLMYLLAGLAATFGFVLVNPELTVPLVGASGAIAGVMGSYVVLFPRHHVMTLVLIRVVAMPAMLFLGLWFLSQFLLLGGESGIAWEAHVAGFLFGAAITLPFRRALLRRTLGGDPRIAGADYP